MRYLIAMLVAVAVAAIVTVFVSPLLANLAVDRFTFEPRRGGQPRGRRSTC